MKPTDPYPGRSAIEVLDAWDAVRGRVIDVPARGAWPTYRARWRAAPLHTCLIAILLGGAVLPWVILIGGILSLAAWDAVTGQ